MQRITFQEKGVLANGITIATLNIDGLRVPYEKESLKAMLHHTAFSIVLITETHVLKAEAEALVAPGYEIIGKAGTSRHRGGVLALADLSVSIK